MPISFSAAQRDDLHVLSVHWQEDAENPPVLLIAVLDGYDDHAKVHGSIQAQAKAGIHRSICRSCLEASEGELCLELNQRFGEGAFAVFRGSGAGKLAVGAALAIHQHLTIWNLEHQLSWEHQIHSRIAITTNPWGNVVDLMPQAMRGNVVVHPELWEEFQDFESVLSSVGVRCADLGAQWAEVVRELEEGIELPGKDLHVSRHFAAHQAKFAANRAAKLAGTVASAAVG